MTRQRQRLKFAKLKLRTDSYKLIQEILQCQFGSWPFDISVSEVAGPSHEEVGEKDVGSVPKGLSFKVAPKSEFASSESVKTKVMSRYRHAQKLNRRLGRRVQLIRHSIPMNQSLGRREH